jgi:4,5-DOPA dioxygenase extradiol
MPALFVGHGSPMNAIEDNAFRRGWQEIARALPLPEAILCVSAHWETSDVNVTASARPETIHDFFGFPDALFAVRYPAPGSPELAAEVERLLSEGDEPVRPDPERGLDHGAWSVLCAMYPDADVPVAQLSLNVRRPPAWHGELGRRLAPLRNQGILLLGSGNIVHNLAAIDVRRKDGYDWAIRFDAEIAKRIYENDLDALFRYRELGPDADRAVPTPEHYLPVLYAAAARERGEAVDFFNQAVVGGSISMRSFVVGS